MLGAWGECLPDVNAEGLEIGSYVRIFLCLHFSITCYVPISEFF